jgi:hypothetical protein
MRMMSNSMVSPFGECEDACDADTPGTTRSTASSRPVALDAVSTRVVVFDLTHEIGTWRREIIDIVISKSEQP